MKKIYTDLFKSFKPPLWIIVRFAIYSGVALALYLFEQMAYFRIILILSIAGLIGPLLANVCRAIASFIERNYFRLLKKKNPLLEKQNKNKKLKENLIDVKQRLRLKQQQYTDLKVKYVSIKQKNND